MYLRYWNLSHSPFENNFEQCAFFDSPSHDEAAARLWYVIERHRPCGILTGAAGCGKSFLIRNLKRDLERSQRQVALVDFRRFDSESVLHQLADSLRLGCNPSLPADQVRRRIAANLNSMKIARIQTVLIFDHLDFAPEQTLRAITQLSLGHADCDATVILACRPGFVGSASPEFVEHTELRILIDALAAEETADYITHRLAAAGCARRIFQPDAIDLIHQQTHGIPREINRLCDLALLAAMSDEAQTIDADLVESTLDELNPKPGLITTHH